MIHLYMFTVSKFPNLKSIIHKFLITGHTQDEDDSALSMIESEVKRVSKSGPIYTPHHFVSIVKAAKKTGRTYKTKEISHKDFFNIKNLGTNYKNANYFRNTRKINEVKVLTVHQSHPLSFFYKTFYFDEEFQEVQLKKCSSRSKTKTETPELPQVYNEKIGISERKKADLLDLIKPNHIPSFYKEFFESLKV